MANSQDLKIYRDVSRLLDSLFRMLKSVERFYRYTVGERMVTLTLDMLELITFANRQEDKVPALTTLADKTVVLTTLFRSCVNNKVLTPKQYAAYAALLDQIGKQITGWKNYAIKHRNLDKAADEGRIHT